ncbi:transferase family-domain-containing protein [Pseudomassariella vexata]|uniref:Transferase family-domain-containing protein n=1 Tax=Pseudomassariella vexata TaxID=1141098 RepID=A0A1Y2DFX5_9PEZI|nr:transferase family-domain-containing protein [Pseudomassariella vexata]ORY58190.1 transferase family-domain-containing protein [Pseudomassariella vexata]
MPPKSNYLSPLDWLMPNTYIRQILCFPSTHPDIPRILQNALPGLVADVQYLLSGVVRNGSPTGSVSLSDAYQTPDDLLSWQDLSSSLDYPTLKRANFSPGALTSAEILPQDTQPPLSNPAPVFRAQLSLIREGFLLCVAVHHRTTDVTGFGALFKMWASHCRTGGSEPVGFDGKWLDRRALFDLESVVGETPSGTLPNLLSPRELAVKVSKLEDANRSPVEFKTSIFFFPDATLKELKGAVNRHITTLETQTDVTWVSSSDVLTAILWSAIIRAETPPPGTYSPGDTSTIGVPVNFCSRYNPPLPKDYVGAAFFMTSATASWDDLISLSNPTTSSQTPNAVLLDHKSLCKLSTIAIAVRAALGRVHEKAVQNALSYVASQSDISSIKLGPPHDGVSLVSWADEGVYDLQWGTGVGRCEAVRIPAWRGRRYPVVLPRVPGTEASEEPTIYYRGQIFYKWQS